MPVAVKAGSLALGEAAGEDRDKDGGNNHKAADMEVDIRDRLGRVAGTWMMARTRRGGRYVGDGVEVAALHKDKVR